jgi:hypothetical protein
MFSRIVLYIFVRTFYISQGKVKRNDNDDDTENTCSRDLNYLRELPGKIIFYFAHVFLRIF